MSQGNRNIKVACIGNTNQFMFNLTRFLRMEGYQADLLLLSEADVFRPENDTFDSKYKSYTHELNWRDIPFHQLKKEDILSDISAYDYIIGCDGVPAFLFKAGINIDIFVPFGEDLYGLPFKRTKLTFTFRFKELYSRIVWKLRYDSYPKAQFKGIKSAKHIFMPKTNTSFEEIICKVGIGGSRSYVSCPSVFTPLYNQTSIAKYYKDSRIHSSFMNLKKNYEKLVIHHSRHLWLPKSDPWSYKGTDIIIKGFKKYTQTKEGSKSCLVLCNYGPDVYESKKLIVQLGIESNVFWLDKLPRKELMIALSLCDIGIGTIGFSWISYTAANEILSFKKPFGHKANLEDLGVEKEDIYPMYNLNTEEDVKMFLSDATLNEQKYKEQSLLAYQWYLNSVDESINQFKKVLIPK